MAKLAVWTLNRATQLLATRRREEKIRRIFSPRHTLDFGRRAGPVGSRYNWFEESAEQAVADASALHAASASTSVHDVPTRGQFRNRVVDSFAHRLMHESPGLDEYFVPIPIKTLGDPRRFLSSSPPGGLHVDVEGRRILQEILGSPKNPYFDPAQDAWLGEYWQTGQRTHLAAYPRVRMNTAPAERCGYYELLAEYSAAHDDCGHILVGYSQGGLVARYLAYLDHHVFKRKIIRGVISVGSPNFGSPLANEYNDYSVVNGVLQMVLAFVGFTLQKSPNTHAALRATRGHRVEDFARIMDAMILDAETGADSGAGGLAAAEGMRSLRKWMTGVVSEGKTAFANLSIADLGVPGSVLDLQHSLPNPLDCAFGAVINANSSLPDIIEPVAPLLAALDWLSGAIDLVPAGQVYAEHVMSENGGTGHARARELIGQWRDGLPRGARPGRPSAAIRPYAHDFIIPSTRMLALDDTNLLGNLVNERANHLTGGSYVYAAGRKNYELVCELMGRLEVRLS